MATSVVTPYGPPAPGNPVYAAMPIVPGAYVVAYAPVFSYRRAGDPAASAVYKVASGGIPSDWILEDFVGIATVTVRGPTGRGRGSKRRKTDEANSCTVQVAGSVSVMVPKSNAPKPGSWYKTNPHFRCTWHNTTTTFQVAVVQPADDNSYNAIGVCLAVAPDKCSITLLLRRDAWNARGLWRTTHHAHAIAKSPPISPGSVTSVHILDINTSVARCTAELKLFAKMCAMLKEENTALKTQVPAGAPAVTTFTQYKDAALAILKGLETPGSGGKSAAVYLARILALTQLIAAEAAYKSTGSADTAASATELSELVGLAALLPNLLRVLSLAVDSEPTDAYLPQPLELEKLTAKWTPVIGP